MAKIFISYSRQDAPFARRLASALSDAGADVWIDVEDIPAGMKWSTAIQEGLYQCEAMLVIISPYSMKSTNVEDEWQFYLDKRKVVIPVRLHPAEVHFQLNRIQYVDFHEQPFDEAFDHLLAELGRKNVFFPAQPPPLEGTADPATDQPAADVPTIAEPDEQDEPAQSSPPVMPDSASSTVEDVAPIPFDSPVVPSYSAASGEKAASPPPAASTLEPPSSVYRRSSDPSPPVYSPPTVAAVPASAAAAKPPVSTAAVSANAPSAPVDQVFWRWLLPAEHFGVPGRILRTLLPGIAFWVALWLRYDSPFVRIDYIYGPTNLLLHSAAVWIAAMRDGLYDLFLQEPQSLPIVAGTIVASGLALNGLSTGIARRRDLPVWQRIALPLITFIPWYYTFALLIDEPLAQQFADMYRYRDSAHLFFGTALWLAALVLPPLLLRSRPIRFVLTAAGLPVAFVFIYGLVPDYLLYSDGNTFLVGRAVQPIVALVVMSIVISGGIWLADWLMPQTGRTRSEG